jgi:4-amino-4-deoxy-L-arabinose transferase-like glycosyltransferase
MYPPFFTVIEQVHVEPLATLCLTLAILFIVRAFRGRGRDHLWAGFALGVLALSRVEYGYALAACFVIACLSMVWTRRSSAAVTARRCVLGTGVGLLLCVPWLTYTYSLTHKVFYWGNAGGLSLYWMAVPGNLGDWHSDTGFTVATLAPDRPFLTRLQSLPPLAQDTRLQSVAIKDIKRDPKHYLSNVLNNLDRLVFNSPYTATQEKARTLLYALPNAILLGLLTISSLIAVRCRRRIRNEQPEFVPIAALTVIAFLVHVPVAAYARFVIPLIPALLWLTIAVIAPSVQLRSRSRATPSAIPV